MDLSRLILHRLVRLPAKILVLLTTGIVPSVSVKCPNELRIWFERGGFSPLTGRKERVNITAPFT